jgi:metal-responsive CopG/Arc/MetJ family transcriptional regulator
MPSKAVQISLDRELLARIDADPDTRARGRSAFIRTAVQLYLAARQRQAHDAAIRRAYGGRADELLAEIEDLMAAQAWPSE